MFRGLRVAPALLVLAIVDACGGGSTGPGVYTGPPMTVTFSSSQVAQGNAVQFTIALPLNAYAGGMPLILTLSGIGSGADTTTVPVDTNGSPLVGTLSIPGGAPDGQLTLTVSLPTLNQSAFAEVTVKDNVAPTVSVGSAWSGLEGIYFVTRSFYSGGLFDGDLLIAGTTDSITVIASDNHLLGWVGWTLNGPTPVADSVQQNAVASDSISLPITVPSSIAGDTLTLTVFAVDADGNRATSSVPVAVSALTTHPVTSVPRGAKIADVAFDSARGVLYIAKPDSQAVDVLTLAGMTFQTPISVSGSPVAVDLSPSGDSLIVGLASPAQLAVISLTSASHPVLGTLPFDAVGVADTLLSMRVMADGNAVATVAHPSQIRAVMSLALSTGTSEGLDSNGAPVCTRRITRSGDRTRALVVGCGGYAKVAWNSVFYSAATHTSAYAPYPAGYTFVGNNAFTSASASGHIFYQFAHTVMDSTDAALLDRVGSDGTYGAVVAPNAYDFYLGEGTADTAAGLYLHYVLQYGTPRQIPNEIAIIPHPAYELAITPDASTLIGITADTISAIDLTHSTPATASQVARFRGQFRARIRKAHRPAVVERSHSYTIRLHGRTLQPIAIRVP